MKTYSLTSTAFEGEVLFVFNEHDLLMSFDQSKATLNEAQQVFLLRKLPRDLVDIKQFLELSPNATFTEVKQEVTFEMFWNRYDEKVRSSKKKAARVWQKMTKTDQVKAYSFITKYFMNIRQGTEKKYAETYLNAELWNN